MRIADRAVPDGESLGRSRMIFVVLCRDDRRKLATAVMPDADPGAIATQGIGPNLAVELCNQAIELAPKHAEAYHVRAIAYEQRVDG